MIQVFSFDACPWCTKAKKYLDKKGVAYKVRDIEKEPAAYDELMKLTGEGACPVILADSGEYVRGFDQPAIDKLIGAYGGLHDKGLLHHGLSVVHEGETLPEISRHPLRGAQYRA